MNYHNITYDDMNNGDGLRVVLWISGCSHHCKNCQNYQTWDKNSGIKFDSDAVDELDYWMKKDYISGITFSGGDPLYKYNLNTVLNIIKDYRANFSTKTIWLYSGYTWEEIFDKLDDDSLMRQEIIKRCDVFVDGEYIDEERDISLKWRGSPNQRVIDVKKTLVSGNIVLHCN